MTKFRAFSARDISVAQALYDGGFTLRDFRFEDGSELLFPEMKLLHKRTFTYRVALSGRHSTVDRQGNVKWGSYDCDVCLAGAVFLASTREFYGKIPIITPSGVCSNPRCSREPSLRSGGGYDGIVIVLPHERISGLFAGEWPVGELGTLRSWSDDYLYAVRASQVVASSLPQSKRKTLYSRKFNTRTMFQEAVMFLCRMRGLQDVAFYHYRESPALFDGLQAGAQGCTALMRSHFEKTFESSQNHMTQYAWGLYDLCKMSAEYSDVQLPLTWFCSNINRVSKHTRAAYHAIRAEYNRQRSVVAGTRVIQPVDDRGHVIQGLVCAECQLFYGATKVVGVGVGVSVTDAQILRVSAGLLRIGFEQLRQHSFRVPVSRPGCQLCALPESYAVVLPLVASGSSVVVTDAASRVDEGLSSDGVG